jgi:heme exporter protein D
MYFDSVHAMLVMDGHGAFVWGAYLVTFVVICAMLTVPVRQRRRLLAQQAAELKRVEGRSVAGGGR